MLVAYAFEIFFIVVFFISQLTGRDATSDEAYDDVIHGCRSLALTTDERCTGGVGGRGYCAFMIHNKLCSAYHERKQPTQGGWQHRRAMKETTASFLDAAIFFALSIGVGAIGTTYSQGLTGYEFIVLEFVFLLTCSPLYIVFAFSSQTLRRRPLRRNLISLVVTLFFCAIWIAPSIFPWDDKGLRWGIVCSPEHFFSYTGTGIAPMFTMAIAFALECLRVLTWLFRLILKRCPPNWWPFTKKLPEKHSGNRRCLQRVIGFGKRYIFNWASEETSIWVVATIGLLFTLFGGVSLALRRARMQRIADKGYKESEMTYGQYLAMLIWVPVLVEYTYVASCKYLAPAANAPIGARIGKQRVKADDRRGKKWGLRGLWRVGCLDTTLLLAPQRAYAGRS